MGSRLEAKIEKCFESGDLYEAHQIYRTLFYRLSAQKKYSELLALLLDGCSRLVKAGELVSAVDLAELYADTLNTGAVKVTEEILNSIQKIFSELPAHLPSDSEVAPGEDRRLKFVGKVVSWSQRGAPTQRERRRGLAALHARLAEVHRAEGNLEASRRHFLLSDHPEELANVLVDMQTKEGYRSEVDLFVAIVVFQLICLRRARMANDLLFAYCRKHPAISTDVLPFELPLLNFCALLLQSITKTRSLRQFSLLVEKYQPELTRAPSFKGYLDKIGQMYFGMPPATRASPGGLLGNLFKGLFGDDSKKDESSSEDEFLEGSPEAMEEDGYDTAPEDEAVRTPRQTQNSSVPAAATGMQTNLDDLD